MKPSIGKLHVLTDTGKQSRYDRIELAGLAIAGGADTIQFRGKDMGALAALETATELRELCKRAAVPLIINDRIDIAIAVDADGVHVGQRDLPIVEARALLGPEKLIGGTASSLDEARQVERDGADYVGFGHIYATRSKRKPGTPRGPESLRTVCAALSIPVIAIGGINAAVVGAVVDAGAAGIAVIDAVCGSDAPLDATAALVAAWNAGQVSRRP